MHRSRSLPLSLLIVPMLALPLLSSCRRAPTTRDSDETAVTRASPASPLARTRTTSAERAAIVNVDVPGDRSVLVVDGGAALRRPVVHLHGMCGDPRDDLEAWGGVARQHGTIVALVGDVPCPGNPSMTQWSTDARALDARVAAALDAVDQRRDDKLERSELVLVGASMGASRAEALAALLPDRYPRLVLVGAPQAASPTKLRQVHAVAHVAGEREPQHATLAGAKNLDAAGIDAKFFELPGATHGAYGPDGERVMSDAIAFVTR